jgi:hypothetical protein
MEEGMAIFKSLIPFKGMSEGAGSPVAAAEARRIRGLRHRIQAGGAQ